MKNLSKRQKNNLLIGGLLAIVLIMAVGYAAFASQLQINGTSNIDSNFCIGFDTTTTNNIAPTTGVVGATAPSGTLTYSGSTCGNSYKTNATINTTLHQPGDKVVYTLTIGNGGNLPAAIESIDVNGTSITTDQTITNGNVTYKVTIPASTTIAANDSTTMTVTAEFQNENDINKYTTGETQSIEVKINAIQSNGSNAMGAGVGGSGYTGTIYTWKSSMSNGKYLAIDGSAITQNEQYASMVTSSISELTAGTDYVTEETASTPSARVNALWRNYYLKHEVVNDTITASYVCQTFGISNFEECVQGGNASYYRYEDTTGGNWKVLKDLESKQEFIAIGSCSFASEESNCNAGYYSLGANSDGSVYARDGVSNKYCSVEVEGLSGCM